MGRAGAGGEDEDGDEEEAGGGRYPARATETYSRAEKRGGSDGYTRPALAPSGVLLVEEERA